MFASNKDSTPFFAVPGAGSTAVTGSSGVGVSTLNGPAHSVIGPLSLSRGNQLSWALGPVTDAKRLQRMKVLYQAMLGHIEFWDAKANNKFAFEDFETPAIITWEEDRSWMQSQCCRTGEYCGCKIRVCPESYPEFSKLVLAIIKVATSDPSPGAAIQVEDFIYGDDGKLDRIHKYAAAAKSKIEPVDADTPKNKIEMSREGEILDSSAFGSSGTNPFFEETQRQVIRNTIFPGR